MKKFVVNMILVASVLGIAGVGMMSDHDKVPDSQAPVDNQAKVEVSA